MTSEGDKPKMRQFLRVQREEDEDTWISGEELKTEGSSGSDDDMPRRKISPRKSRRRRSEGYAVGESRLSLPNLEDNKSGIAFRLSRPCDAEESKETKGERVSIGSDLSTVEEQRFSIEAAMARMKTRASLDKACELDECDQSESDWRPKRGSLKLPTLEEEVAEKCVRFADELAIDGETKPQRELNGFRFDIDPEELDFDMDESEGSGDYFGNRPVSNMPDASNTLFEKYAEEKLLENVDLNGESRRIKRRMNLPDFEEASSVKTFISEMNDFYNDMSSKLSSLKNCPILENSEISPLDPSDEKFIGRKNFKNLYKELKKTPQVKKTLSLISKMDSDISDTISKFREERAQRLDMQRKLIKTIPRDRESQLFLQLCDFEAKSNEKLNSSGSEKKPEKNKGNRKNGKSTEDKNFIERNIELAKMGMNFSLSDEQKQRLERILQDESATLETNEYELLPSPIRRVNNMPELTRLESLDHDIYQSCVLNAYRMSDDHKGRLLEIDSALQEFDEGQSRGSSDSSIGVDLVRSLKDIDEKLHALSASYIQDEALLQKNRKTLSETDIKKMEEELIQKNGNEKNCENYSTKNMTS